MTTCCLTFLGRRQAWRYRQKIQRRHDCQARTRLVKQENRDLAACLHQRPLHFAKVPDTVEAQQFHHLKRIQITPRGARHVDHPIADQQDRRVGQRALQEILIVDRPVGEFRDQNDHRHRRQRVNDRHILIESQIAHGRAKRDDQHHIGHRHLGDRSAVQDADQKEAIEVGKRASENDLEQKQPRRTVKPHAPHFKWNDVLHARSPS